MPWYNVVSYNSIYHVKVLQVTEMTKLHCQLEFNQILNMPPMVSLLYFCKKSATSRFMEKTFLRLTNKQILFVYYLVNW